jgi:hypothetical protein
MPAVLKLLSLMLPQAKSNRVNLVKVKTADFGQLGPHQIEALVANSIIFEVGTGDYVEDRFRLAPGDTQTKQSAQ